jgi:hypothetical protein
MVSDHYDDVVTVVDTPDARRARKEAPASEKTEPRSNGYRHWARALTILRRPRRTTS